MAAARPTGTVRVNEADLHYGDRATFSVTASEYPCSVHCTFWTPDGLTFLGQSSSATIYKDGPVADDVGLYSPIWHGGPAVGKAELVLFKRKRRPVIATTEFEIGA